MISPLPAFSYPRLTVNLFLRRNFSFLAPNRFLFRTKAQKNRRLFCLCGEKIKNTTETVKISRSEVFLLVMQGNGTDGKVK
jgi:hypothetical protein